MGGCATKPKVSKPDAAEAPAPEPLKEEREAKDVVAEEVKKVEGDIIVNKEKEIVDVDTVDEHGNKRRSLSNLFKEILHLHFWQYEGEEGESNKTPPKPVKQEEQSVNQKPSDVSNINPPDSGKMETPAEQIAKEVETQVEQVPTKEMETSVETNVEKLVDVVPSTGTTADEAIQSPAVVEAEKAGEKTALEEKPAAEGQKHETVEEKKTVEEKAANETQTLDVPEEKVIKEDK
ncbi:hypothetical protein NMG60_11007125 [Bertholletia excelsa]